MGTWSNTHIALGHRSHLLRRVAVLGLAAVLVASSAFSMWASATTQNRAKNAIALVTISDSYHQIRYWVTQEETLERKYRLEPGPLRRSYHNLAVAWLMKTLLTLRTTSTPADRAIIDSVITANNRYVLAMRDMFNAVDKHDESRVEAIHTAIDPTYDRVERITNGQETRYHALAYRAIGALDRTQRVLSVLTPLIDVIGLGLLAVCGYIVHVYRRQIEQNAQTELMRLERVALTDNLTGLRNHRAYHEDLQRELNRALRNTRPLTLALIDVDFFKAINDNGGHAYGDKVLITLGTHLQAIRRADCAYRIGGDEFALIFADTSPDGAQIALQRLRELLDSDTMSITLSIGIADCFSTHDTAAELQSRADAMLYEAKRQGRNRIIAFSRAVEHVKHDHDTDDHGSPKVIGNPVNLGIAKRLVVSTGEATRVPTDG